MTQEISTAVVVRSNGVSVEISYSNVNDVSTYKYFVVDDNDGRCEETHYPCESISKALIFAGGLMEARIASDRIYQARIKELEEALK